MRHSKSQNEKKCSLNYDPTFSTPKQNITWQDHRELEIWYTYIFLTPASIFEKINKISRHEFTFEFINPVRKPRDPVMRKFDPRLGSINKIPPSRASWVNQPNSYWEHNEIIIFPNKIKKKQSHRSYNPICVIELHTHVIRTPVQLCLGGLRPSSLLSSSSSSSFSERLKKREKKPAHRRAKHIEKRRRKRRGVAPGSSVKKKKNYTATTRVGEEKYGDLLTQEDTGRVAGGEGK